jgi:hypothetical protein
LATYKALPGGATVTSDGSGVFGTSGVAVRDVFNNLGRAVCADAGVMVMRTKPQQRKRIIASDLGPGCRKILSVETAVFTDATVGHTSLPVTSDHSHAVAGAQALSRRSSREWQTISLSPDLDAE